MRSSHRVKLDETQSREELRFTASAKTPTDRTASDSSETAGDNCPVIRANQVFLSSATSGRLRVVFF